jgi:hypothetical protein
MYTSLKSQKTEELAHEIIRKLVINQGEDKDVIIDAVLAIIRIKEIAEQEET